VVWCTVCEAKASQPTLSALALVNDYPTCLLLDAVTQRWEVHCRLRFAGEKRTRVPWYMDSAWYVCVASAAKSTTCLGHPVMGGGGIYRSIGFVDLFGYVRLQG